MSADDCNLPYVAAVTGINAKTLSSWANSRSKLPALDRPRMNRTKVFDWVVIRPILVAEVKRAKAAGEKLDHKPITSWPK